jgi:hypothetical protein
MSTTTAPGFRATTPQPRLRVGAKSAVAILVLLVVLGVVLWRVFFVGSAAADATAELRRVGAPFTELHVPGHPQLARLDCEAFAYCESASVSWATHDPPLTFAAVEQATASWSTRNRLSDMGIGWLCGLHTGLFGAGPAAPTGCQISLRPNHGEYPPVIWLAVTFVDPDAVASAGPRRFGPPVPSGQVPGLEHLQVRSLAVQALVGVHARY